MTNAQRTVAKYFSEILIIFIGITISFWFENWREAQNEKAELRKMVVSLRTDLQEKKKEIEGDFVGVQSWISKLDSSMALIKSGQCTPEVLEEIRFDLGNDHWFFLTTTPTYLSATNTGTWQQMPDSLKHQVYDLYLIEFRYLEVITEKEAAYSAACKLDLMVSSGMTDLKTMNESEMKALCQSKKLNSYAGLLREQWKKIIRFSATTLTKLDKTSANLDAFLKNY